MVIFLIKKTTTIQLNVVTNFFSFNRNSIFTNLKNLFPTHACREFNRVFPLLEEHCGYKDNNIPQLEDISNFLQSKQTFLTNRNVNI